MPALTALWFDTVPIVKLVQGVQPRAEPAEWHNSVNEVRVVAFDSLSVGSAFIAVMTSALKINP